MRQKGWFKLNTRKVIGFTASVEVHGTTLFTQRGWGQISGRDSNKWWLQIEYKRVEVPLAGGSNSRAYQPGAEDEGKAASLRGRSASNRISTMTFSSESNSEGQRRGQGQRQNGTCLGQTATRRACCWISCVFLNHPAVHQTGARLGVLKAKWFPLWQVKGLSYTGSPARRFCLSIWFHHLIKICIFM